MKKIILLSVVFTIYTTYSTAQKVRWPYELNDDSYGAGVPWKLGKDEAKYYAGYYSAKKDKKQNHYFHYEFMPFDAQQLMIMEVENHPVSIRNISIGYLPEGEKKAVQKEIYSKDEPQAMKVNRNIRNIGFKLTGNITEVWIYFETAEGNGRIAGIALTDFPEPYTPGINLLENDPFDDELLDMNEDAIYKDLGELLSPTGPVISNDGKTIYFTSMIKDLEKQIYDYQTTAEEGVAKIFKASIGDDGKIAYALPSNLNLEDRISRFSSIAAISDDQSVMYINTLDVDRNLHIYKVYTTKDEDGYAVFHRDKIKFDKYLNQSEYITETMSSDKEYIIVSCWKKDKHYAKFERDLYVARKIKEDQYGPFIRMGDDINTIGADLPCYLAADNKTLFFASNGHLGYGDKDIYVSRRLDDSWQNWSQPVNLGPRINSEGTENYFIIDARGEHAYLVKWGADEEGFSDLYRVKINPPKLEECLEQTLKPKTSDQ